MCLSECVFSSVTSDMSFYATMFTDPFTFSQFLFFYSFNYFFCSFSISCSSHNGLCCFSFAIIFLFLLPLPGCLGGEYQRKLYRDLMENYNRLERPVQNDSAPIVVELGLTLLQIIDVVSVYMHGNMHGNSIECQITSNVPPFFFVALFTVCILFPSDLFTNQEQHSVVSALHCSALAGQKPLRPKKLQALRPRVPMMIILFKFSQFKRSVYIQSRSLRS